MINTINIFADDMPELQEVEEDQRSPGLFQVGAGVSHQELSCSPNTNWLAELANIATSPQSPLLKDAPHKRLVRICTSFKSSKSNEFTHWQTQWEVDNNHYMWKDTPQSRIGS